MVLNIISKIKINNDNGTGWDGIGWDGMGDGMGMGWGWDGMGDGRYAKMANIQTCVRLQSKRLTSNNF